VSRKQHIIDLIFNTEDMSQELDSVSQELRMTRMEDKIDIIYTALVGNNITADGGMVERLKKVEDRVQRLETEFNRYKWSLLGLTTVGPVIAAFVLWILKQLRILT
jgi:hypothetical protein